MDNVEKNLLVIYAPLFLGILSLVFGIRTIINKRFLIGGILITGKRSIFFGVVDIIAGALLIAFSAAMYYGVL